MNTQQFKGHTPGPWSRVEFSGYIQNQKGNLFCNVLGVEDSEFVQTILLIAAAPELLAEVDRLQNENEALKQKINRLLNPPF